MNEFSFDPHDFYLSLPEKQAIAIRIVGEQAIYVPDASATSIESSERCGRLHAHALKIIGTDITCEGSLDVQWTSSDDEIISLVSTARLPEPCRSLVYLFDGMSPQTVDYVALDGSCQVADRGLVKQQIPPINYPRLAKMPLWFVTSSQQQEYYFLWHTNQVESRNFGSFYSSYRESQLAVLSHHQRRTKTDCSIAAPALEFGRCTDRTQVIDKRLKDLELSGVLIPYPLRADKPDWLDSIRLTIYLHGQHWSGFRHNTFSEMQEALETLRSSFEPGRVLCIVLGWDGPYYHAGPRLSPTSQLGGERAFAQLRQTISDFGGKLIVFTPLCVVGRKIVEEMGWQEGVLRRPWGAEAWCDWCDWNGDLENEPSVFMNLGYVPFREYVIEKYRALVEQYGIDGIYFDVTKYWEDDPYHDHLEGIQTMVAALRAIKDDLLICAENWYDHLLGVFPLFGEPGNVMGPGDLLLRYCRMTAYVACPSPLGSGGVHEKGRNYLGTATLKDSTIPYLTIAEDWKLCIKELSDIAAKAMRWKP